MKTQTLETFRAMQLAIIGADRVNGYKQVDLPSNMEEFDLYHAFKDEVEDDYLKM